MKHVLLMITPHGMCTTMKYVQSVITGVVYSYDMCTVSDHTVLGVLTPGCWLQRVDKITKETVTASTT